MFRRKLLTAAFCMMLAMAAPLCVSATEDVLDEDVPSVLEVEDTADAVDEETETEEEMIVAEEGDAEAEISIELGETSGTDDELDLRIVEVVQYALDEDLVPAPENSGSSHIDKEFRFTQVDKQFAVVSRKDGCTVYEGQGEDYRPVGELAYYGVCYVLESVDEEWVYVESGNVRGFVKSENLVTGDVAHRIINVRGEEELPEARLTISKTDNAAFTYTTTTVNDVLANKEYAIAENDIEIYEQKKIASRVTGLLPRGGLCYILEDTGTEWLYVESGDARGFVQANALKRGIEVAASVEELGEDNMIKADLLISPKDNRACYYTLTSVEEASQSWKLRESIVDFALQFLGNPYVWGGTSLTNGADCSGFVQSVYANFGYYLPRVTWDQAAATTTIPISEALPGDLIFYFDGSTIYHVSMYVGDGVVVHAASTNLGIITSGIGRNAVYAGRVIQD